MPFTDLGSRTPAPKGLIRCGLHPAEIAGLLFLLLIVEFKGTRETVCAFQIAFKEVNEAFSRAFPLNVIEAIRCSLAFLDALVSRANLGVKSLDFEAIPSTGCWGVRVCVLDGMVWLRFSRLRRERGAPRPEGSLTNRLSAEVDVGKSSNDASSVPSPKLRRRVGRVSVLFVEVTKASGLDSFLVLPKASWRLDRDRRDEACELNASLELSEFVRRDCR